MLVAVTGCADSLVSTADDPQTRVWYSLQTAAWYSMQTRAWYSVRSGDTLTVYCNYSAGVVYHLHCRNSRWTGDTVNCSAPSFNPGRHRRPPRFSDHSRTLPAAAPGGRCGSRAGICRPDCSSCTSLKTERRTDRRTSYRYIRL